MYAHAARAIFAVCALVPLAQSQVLTPTYANIPYGPHALETLDVYIPSSATAGQPVPAVIEIHAGGWAGGEKSFFPVYGGLIEMLHSRGIAIISINYPLAPQDLFPAAAESARRAVQYARSRSSAWNIDPTKFGVVGCSSGAHLAMWVAAAPDAQLPGNPGPVLGSSSRVQVCIAYAGPSDLTDQYYKHEGLGHAASPVWQLVGVNSQAEWDALPQATKDYLSPREHALNPANQAAIADLRFLGIFPGSQVVTQQNQVNYPTGDIHHLVHGLAFRDALLAAGSQEAIVWSSYTTYDTTKGLLANEFAADWMALQLSGAAIRTIPGGTPGCISQQYMSANSTAFVGNANFKLRSYNGFPNSIGLLAISDGRFSEPTDYFGVGCNLIVNPLSTELIGADVNLDADGRTEISVPIANYPALQGKVYYAQIFSAWTYTLGTFPYCQPSPLGLVSTPALEITIQ